MEVAQQINEKGPMAIKMAKKAIDEGIETNMASGLELEEMCYQKLLNTEDRLEGLAAFAEKRKPRYTGKWSSFSFNNRGEITIVLDVKNRDGLGL